MKFKNDNEFSNYIRENHPSEIWLDEFSIDEPYIIIDGYDNKSLRGCYNHQCLLAADLNDLNYLFKKGMYTK